jgi:hypothetical protein
VIKEWFDLRKHPILGKSRLRLLFLQLHLIWLVSRRPVPKTHLDFNFLQPAIGPVWINFNAWIRFQLQFIDSRFWATSPIIRGVALVNLDTTYEFDEFRIPSDKRQTINSLSVKYSSTFDVVTRLQFKNWITRNYLISRAFSEFNVDPISDSEDLVEIGPGLGAIISLALISDCKEVYSFDTYEMQATYSAMARNFPNQFSRIRNITINDVRTLRPFAIPSGDYTVIAFWSFTELTEKERCDYLDLFKSAKRIIIGSNEEFEGVSNFRYIENLAISLGMSLYWKTMGEIFATELPPYQRNHRIYLLLAD